MKKIQKLRRQRRKNTTQNNYNNRAHIGSTRILLKKFSENTPNIGCVIGIQWLSAHCSVVVQRTHIVIIFGDDPALSD